MNVKELLQFDIISYRVTVLHAPISLSVCSFLICALFGLLLSIPTFYNWFFTGKLAEYLKAGEYGEAEIIHKWSLFKEPLNSFSSLFYSLFGIFILLTGIIDYTLLWNGSELNPTNKSAINPAFTVIFGLSSTYLGNLISFLFHRL
jgi:hypothetical protein